MGDIPQWFQFTLVGIAGAFALWIKARFTRSTATLERETIQEALAALKLKAEVARQMAANELHIAQQLAQAQGEKIGEVQSLLIQTHEAVNSGRTRLEEDMQEQRVVFERRIALLESNLAAANVSMAHAQGLAQQPATPVSADTAPEPVIIVPG